MSIIEKIDESLESYYSSFQNLKTINTYKNNDNIGKFALYCQENGIEDGDIESELEGGSQDCCLIEFDLDEINDTNLFPLNKPISDESQQNEEIFRIIKNMYIDAKAPQHQPSQNEYIFTGQNFVYEGVESEEKERDDVSLLLFGYIHRKEEEYKLDEYVGGIPTDIIKIMIFFYGKKYIIHGPKPKEPQYDYAMEILSPIHQIGIQHIKSKIVSLTRQTSQKNIIFGSNIIQINDIYITPKMEQKLINELLDNAKKITPSYVVFRCKKDDHQKGTHLQFDVSFDAKYAPKAVKFPYYKFKKDAVHEVFERVFADDGDIDIMEIYANKQTTIANGTWGGNGVSILIFINNNEKLYKNYEIFEKVELVQRGLKEKINENLVVRFNQKLESIKANGINCGWYGRRSLYDLCWLVKEDADNNDRDTDIWYFIMVDIERFDYFQMEHSRNILNVSGHGHILLTSIGFPPTKEEQLKILKDYAFYSCIDPDIMMHRL